MLVQMAHPAAFLAPQTMEVTMQQDTGFAGGIYKFVLSLLSPCPWSLAKRSSRLRFRPWYPKVVLPADRLSMQEQG
jgi:hypothetical protein